MEYRKPPLTFEQQSDQLLARGMAGERALMVERLKVVSYYRLSGYWYPFRKEDPHTPGKRLDEFQHGTTFDTVWNRYAFDRRLRLLILDAIERIEVAVRSRLAYAHSHAYGPFAYAEDPRSLPRSRPQHLKKFLRSVRDEAGRSKDEFVKHFDEKYADRHQYLPVWMGIEVMTFGSVLTFFRGCNKFICKEASRPFGVHETVFRSWLLTLNTVRNICAHHGRLWNRVLGVEPKIPDKDPAWKQPVEVDGRRIFGVLTICKWCLDRVAPQSQWPNRLRNLLNEFPDIPRKSMGFLDHWEQCPIWTQPTTVDQGGQP